MADGSVPLIGASVVTPAAEFVNGWTDAPNAIAAVLSDRVPSPFQGVLTVAVLDGIAGSVALRILW